MLRPVHFEIPVTDAGRAIAFYSAVFQWQFHKWDGPMEYWTIKTGDGPGIDGGLIVRPGAGEGGTVNTMDVPDIDARATLAESKGGTVVVPKMAIPGVGWLVYLKDPDGNLFGMMQEDPAAA